MVSKKLPPKPRGSSETQLPRHIAHKIVEEFMDMIVKQTYFTWPDIASRYPKIALKHLKVLYGAAYDELYGNVVHELDYKRLVTNFHLTYQKLFHKVTEIHDRSEDDRVKLMAISEVRALMRDKVKFLEEFFIKPKVPETVNVNSDESLSIEQFRRIHEGRES